MARGITTSYSSLKSHLPAPARRVVEELLEAGLAPEEVLIRLAHDEGCDIYQAYGYVREVLWRSLMEMTDAPLITPLTYTPPHDHPTPVAAG